MTHPEECPTAINVNKENKQGALKHLPTKGTIIANEDEKTRGSCGKTTETKRVEEDGKATASNPRSAPKAGQDELKPDNYCLQWEDI